MKSKFAHVNKQQKKAFYLITEDGAGLHLLLKWIYSFASPQTAAFFNEISVHAEVMKGNQHGIVSENSFSTHPPL